MASTENLSGSTVGTLNAVVWTAASFAVVIVALRLYVRLFLKRFFGADDVAVIIAMVFLVAYAGVCSAAGSFGLGMHLEYIMAQNPENLTKVALLADIGEVFAIMACTLSKTSFAITLLRLVYLPWMKVTLWFIIVTMNTANFLTVIFIFAQCKDPRHLWNPDIPSECWPTYIFTNYSLFVGAYSGAQDFILALLPWAVLWNLQIEKKEKYGVAVAMSAGVFAGVASIVKTTYLVALSAKSDFTWALAPLLWWAAIEDGLAIVASSIPTLRPLLKKFRLCSIFKGGLTSDKRSYPFSSVSYSIKTYNSSSKVPTLTTMEVIPENYPSDGDQSNRSILNQQETVESQRYNHSSAAAEDHQETLYTTTEALMYT